MKADAARPLRRVALAGVPSLDEAAWLAIRQSKTILAPILGQRLQRWRMSRKKYGG